MIKEFNNLEEIEKYYIKDTNTYIFKEDGEYIDLVVFNFNLNVPSNIDVFSINAQDITAHNIHADNIKARDIKVNDIYSWDIKARNINARNITALDIKAYNINASDIDACDINTSNLDAKDISYYAVCTVYNNIRCKSIIGRRKNAKHFVLDGKLEVEND